jgi:hypothetical protein
MPTKPKDKTSIADIKSTLALERSDRDRLWWGRYICGERITDIAAADGVTPAAVGYALRREQDAVAADRRNMAEEYVQRELDGLDTLERRLSQALISADPAEAASISNSIIKVKERRARYMGLDRPAEVKHTFTLESLVAGAPVVGASVMEPDRIEDDGKD